MKAQVHYRKAGSFRALCGAGYDYPSTIAFAREDRPATCPACILIWDADRLEVATGLAEMLDQVVKATEHITPAYVEKRFQEMLSALRKEEKK